MHTIKLLLFTVLITVILASCKKEEQAPTNQNNNNNPPALEGGKGGSFSVAVFSEHNGAGKEARIYFKYAANKMPSDTTAYDEVYNTMVEPGYGPHAHFNGLKKGTYYTYIKAGNMTGEKVIEVTDTSALLMDVYVEVK